MKSKPAVAYIRLMNGKTTFRDVNANSRSGYYPVLDALRFVLAFWVAVGHFEMLPLFGDPHRGTGFWHLFQRGWSTVVFGTPAVIVFFVISGFCIHLPFRGTTKIDIIRYYLRRYTRILIPVGAATLVYRLMGWHLIFRGEHSFLWDSPLWSLACEEIYYLLYPALRWIRNAVGWTKMLPASFLAGAGIAATHLRASSWNAFGPFGTAMILLPVWLLGCSLAEHAEALGQKDLRGSIWFWRFIAWTGCWVSEMMHFKLHIPYTQTMIWFGVIAYFWVRQEIAHGKAHPPSRYLVAGGAWSYSLYLMHVTDEQIVSYLGLPGLTGIVKWCAVMGAALGFSYLFYLVVERPSHKLARKFKVRRTERVADHIQLRSPAPAGNQPAP